MKTNSYILFSIILLGILSACTKESLLTYNTKDSIYFELFKSFNDSLNVSFAYSNASVQDSLVKIPVFVTGVPADRNRIFTLSVDPSSTAIENTHYSFPTTFTIHKGQVSDSIAIQLMRTEDLKTAMKTLILNLTNNDEFNTDLKAEDNQIITASYKITISDILSKGQYWSDWKFGTFSLKKLQLLRDIAGMPFDFLIAPPDSYRIWIDYYSLILYRYLLDQANAGNIIYEEDGVTPMRMGDAYPI